RPVVAHVPILDMSRGLSPGHVAKGRASGYGGSVILVVAATQGELNGADGASTLVCGVAPVDAAARTAAALVERPPDALLHVGIAGARSFDEAVLVIGSEAVYCDADDPRWIELRAQAHERLVEA